MKFSPNRGSVCYATSQPSSNTHEASLGWGLKSINSHKPFSPKNPAAIFIPASLMALCDVFHFTVHSRRLLCSSSLRQGASEPETVVEIFVHVGRVCAVLCPHHTRPKQLCSVSMPYIDASIELCNVTCCFICCAAKDSCVQRVSQHLLDQELGVTTLSTAKMNSTFKKPWILLDLPCRNKECAR